MRLIANATGNPGLTTQLQRGPRRQARTTIATPEEIAALTAAASPWLRCAIQLAVHAGLRASDAMSAAPQNYNADTQTLSLTQQKTGTRLIVPVSPNLAQTLDHFQDTSEKSTPFVQLLAGRTLTVKGLSSAWDRLRTTTHTNRKLTFHDLRRTLAVSLYEVSKDLRVVEQMLGHQSLASTAQYLEHRDPEKLRAVLAQLWTPKGPVQ